MDREVIMTTLLARLSAPPLVYSFTADVTAGSTALANFIGDTASLMIGMPVTGKGLDADTVLATTAPPTLSKPAIGSAPAARVYQGFREIGRRLKFWTDVAVQPAIFLVDGDEDHPTRPSTAPSRPTLKAFAWVYTKTTDATVSPVVTMNKILDALEKALYPAPNSPHGVWQNLGLAGVIHARIEGQILKDAGHLDGQSIARVPILIQVAQGPATRAL